MGGPRKGKVKGYSFKRRDKMKVLFINPDWDGIVSKKGSRFNRKWPPLCLLNCASLLEKEGVEAEIIDLRAQKMPVQQVIEKTGGADKVFVTSSPIDRWQCPNIELKAFFELLGPIRKDRLYIMGAHGTMFPGKMLAETGAKAVIKGEPELTVLDLCRTDDISGVSGIAYIRGGQVIHAKDRPLLNMNSLPVPAYHLIDISKYEYELLGGRLALLETSRGCPFSCSYCYQGMYGWTRLRRKTAENVTGEIDYVVRAVGARSLYFIDLEFTLDRDFTGRICDHIIASGYDIRWCCQTRADTVDMELLRKMRQAGCSLIHFGVETGSQRVMDSINKKIKLSQIEDGVSMAAQAGLETACFFMFGFPGETSADMEATIKFALRLNPAYASFHIAAPYPGTGLYGLQPAEGAFPEAYTQDHPIGDLRAAVQSALKRFYMRPSYIFSRILRGNPASWKKQARLFLEFIR